MISDYVILVMEWIGTVAFSVSGALVSISCGLDLFGVITVGCITAVGGGVIRDLLIGSVPPQIFFNPWLILLAAVTSAAVFAIAYFNARRFKGLRARVENINIIFDAIGLAAFSVAGVETVCAAGFADKELLVITLGLITGVGGGILRDILVNEKPYVLTKHIYAVASIFGCAIYYLFSTCWNMKILGTFVALIFIITVRMLAAKYRWKLPKIKFEENEEN